MSRKSIDLMSLKMSIAMNNILELGKSLEEIIDEEPALDSIIFPQTIGSITFYSSSELLEWVEKQQLKNANYIHGTKSNGIEAEWVYDHWCEFKCSNCGAWSTSQPHKGIENYCPECGAKMTNK